jgi:ABC-type Fe3+/spermidine/putrescine transport system ATPase subunit
MEVARFFGNHNQLEGTRTGDVISTPVGDLAIVDPGGRPWPTDGPVCVHVRPESVQIVPADSAGTNHIDGVVSHRVYVGTHIRYVVEVGGQPWRAVAGPLDHAYDEGDPVRLRLPPERIWLTRE